MKSSYETATGMVNLVQVLVYTILHCAIYVNTNFILMLNYLMSGDKLVKL